VTSPTAAIERLPATVFRPRRHPVWTEGQCGADAQRDRDRACDSDPELGQHVAPAHLVEEGDQDADDEAGFEAFAQTDQCVCEHSLLSGENGNNGCRPLW
jgi:hypothetical protein